MPARPVPPARPPMAGARDPGPEGDPAWSAWQTRTLGRLEAALSDNAMLARAPLLEALAGAIRHAIAAGTPAAIVFIDLNGFVEINSAWGPSGGDEALAVCGRRIVEFAAGSLAGAAGPAIAGRLDADHFVIIVPQVDSLEDLRRTTADLLRELSRPFGIDGSHISLAARAAVIQVPVHARSATTVLGRGFRLLNTAARVRADGVVVSQAETDREASSVDLERDLVAALGADQLFIALQPKVGARGGEVKGAEALVRWRHPSLGLLPPPVFIETAEKSGLIFDLGLRILRDACRAGNSLLEAGRGLPIAVNVSPYQLAHPDFLTAFLEVIDRENVAPHMLEVEITETAAMMGGERVLESLQALRRCGMSVAIDDFGTGFSNLASLAALPADALKIDRSLVTGADHGGKAAALLEIAVRLGQTFGMSTVAEGVETPRQLRSVTDLGCDLVQGYLTGRPVRAGDFADCYLKS